MFAVQATREVRHLHAHLHPFHAASVLGAS
jgi:hypothetical protein